MLYTKPIQYGVQNLLQRYHRGVDQFFANTGGFQLASKRLKILIFYAYSETLVIQKNHLTEFRVLQRNLCALLETTNSTFDELPVHIFPEPKEAFKCDGQPRPDLYYPRLHEGTLSLWEYYPRYLNKNEFVKPASFFEEFFAYKGLLGWKITFEELLHASLFHKSVADFSDENNNPIQVYEYALKFLEASHLINVRQKH